MSIPTKTTTLSDAKIKAQFVKPSAPVEEDVYERYAMPDPAKQGKWAKYYAASKEKHTEHDNALLTDDLKGYEEVHARQRKRRVRAAAFCAAALIVISVAFGIYELQRPPDIGAYADEQILLEIPGEWSLVITPRELAEMDCEWINITGAGRGAGGQSKAGVVEAYGPSLATVLAKYGYEQSDFRKVVVECKDDYTVILTQTVLQEDDVYLSIARGKKPLFDEQTPMRIVAPSMDTGQWGYGVVSMRFSLAEAKIDLPASSGSSESQSEMQEEASDALQDAQDIEGESTKDESSAAFASSTSTDDDLSFGQKHMGEE